MRSRAILLTSALMLSACGGGGASVGGTASATAVESMAESAKPEAGTVRFSFTGEEPAVSREMTGIEEAYINPGAVIEHDGVLHMFANVFTAWPGLVQVPHLTSTDGVAWHLEESEPVLTSAEMPFGTGGADVSTGFIADDGTWVLIFETVSTSEPWLLGRATAPSPSGPWTVDPDPILEPGAAGSPDAGGLAWPSVVRTEAGYAMYFTSIPAPRTPGSIGMATSADGITWTKADEPALAAELDWEQGGLDRPRVAATEDGFVMVYSGADLTDRGVAFSPDGVTWTRDGELPAITQDDFPADGRCWDAALVNVDGTLHYYLEIGVANASRGTQVYLATADLP